ncbi:S9 family peptidase [uncultured Alistipes sp.]|uniref:S9 family peptidase n=1 Tax=uncultured Alistipes sp. TaxID=538949 RepID=UPI002616FB60|nr:S9 family peptidase [uncultured Alistipes sp.]
MKTRLFSLLAAALLCAGTAQARGEYAEIARLRSMNEGVRGIRSMADGEHYTTLEGNNIVRYGYAAAGRGQSMLPSPTANLVITDYTFSPDERQILIASGAKPIYRHSYTTSYYLARGGSLTPVLREAEAPRDASFSPDGKLIAYSDRNDLYVYDTAAGQTRRITDDGAWNAIINGTTDWVYEEEFGFTKAYAFSPDSRRIAYLRFDETEVPLMEMMRFDGKLYNEAYSFKYPKAGERNSTVEVWVCDLQTGAKERIDTGGETDQYIPRIGWTPDGRLYFFRLNRRQNTFEVILCEPHGAQRTIYDERSQQYVERVDDKTVTFVDSDRFLVRQESHTGYMHLYLYSIRKGFLAQVTKGPWEVTDLIGTDGKRVWYLSTETSPLRRNLYSVRLDGRDKRRLTNEEGFYTIASSAGMKYYIATFSNAATPNRVEICDGEGNPVRTLFESRALREQLAATQRPVKEFFTFVTERGDTLNAYLIKPRGFDPSQRYPVLLTQYSGPGSQSVRDRWSLDWEDALADKGYIVACTDGRGTGFRGEKFKKITYGRLGALEVEDQLSFARYLAAQPYADPARIGIYGWSYGGFMALSCALKGHGIFKMAIAVAPVTSWRYYDSIYTEIYNNLPQYNAAGYDDNSPINFARMLDDRRTQLLLIHGTADDNVHFQNTVEMTRALNRCGKQYDMMVYPDQNHSMQPNDTANVRQKMIEYTLGHL